MAFPDKSDIGFPVVTVRERGGDAVERRSVEVDGSDIIEAQRARFADNIAKIASLAPDESVPTLSEGELQPTLADFLDAIDRAGELPSHLSYATPESADLWCQVADREAYTHQQALHQLRSPGFQDFVRDVAGTSNDRVNGIAFVDLGSSDGGKGQLFLDTLRLSGILSGSRYVPVDASFPLLTRLFGAVQVPQLMSFDPHCMTFHDFADLYDRSGSKQPHVFQLAGLTVGNNPGIFEDLNKMTRPGDVVLVDFQSSADGDRHLLGQYDTPLWRQFTLQPVRDMVQLHVGEDQPFPQELNGLLTHAAVKVSVTETSMQNIDGARIVEFHLSDDAIDVVDEFLGVTLPRPFSLYRSVKYPSREAFEERLGRAGFQVLQGGGRNAGSYHLIVAKRLADQPVSS